MQVYVFREGTKAGVFDFAQAGVVFDHVDVGGVVVVDLVAEDLHVVDGHHVHASARGQMVNSAQALGREIRGVVFVDLVVKNADILAALLGQIGQVEDAQPAGVVHGDVFVDIDVLGVLHFVTVHVIFGAIAAHDHVV